MLGDCFRWANLANNIIATVVIRVEGLLYSFSYIVENLIDSITGICQGLVNGVTQSTRVRVSGKVLYRAISGKLNT